MHVYPGERFGYNPLEGGVDGSYFGKSPNGWMTQDLFYGWLTGHFVQQIPPTRPVCLILDGHSSHIDLEVSKFCDENGILLYRLPPHSSHILQPLDVGVFSPLKHEWQYAVAKFQQENIGMLVDKRNFARIFNEAYQRTIKLATIVNAFKRSGIFPVDRHAISANKLAPSQLYCQKSSQKADEKQQGSVPAPRLALKALEEELDEQTKKKFEERYEEGYDVIDDALYSTWVKLKKRSRPLVDVTNQQKPSPSQPSVVEMKKVDPHVRELLKVPVCSVPAKKTTRGTAHIPKHLSGKEMIRLLEEKKMKKDQEAADKAKRKAEREEKKRRKEEEKIQKEKRKQEKVTRKKYTAKNPTPPPTVPSKEVASSSETVCPMCDGVYEEEGENSECWVECTLCNEWYHLECSGILEDQYSNLEDFDFICKLCM